MVLNLRKFIVGLIVFVALLGVYVAYTRLGGSAPTALHEVAAPNAVDLVDVPDEREGKIGDAVIGPIRQTRLTHTDANNRPDRVFGFEELYHKEGSQWEATHPFMKLYLSGFTCSVTADKGNVEIETGLGQPEPNDAAFSGNVVIHIEPSEPNDLREVFIYLDDVQFIASRSLFSTLDAVRFVSRSAQLLGRGMELLYDEQRGRLELFRVYELDSLRLRSDAFRSLSKSSRVDGAPAQQTKAATPPTAQEPNGRTAAQPTSYECVFSRDVHIVTPEQIIYAEEQLAVTDILWSSPQRDTSNDSSSVARGLGPQRRDVNDVTSETERLPYPGPEALDTTGSKSLAFESLPESFFDIVVTCSRGVVVRPEDFGPGAALSGEGGADAWMGATPPVDVNEVDPNSRSPLTDRSARFAARAANDERRQIITARRIDFDASKVNTTLSGPVHVSFHLDPNVVGGASSDGRSIPATVDAQREVRFLSATNQVVLDGNCVVDMHKAEPNVTTEYRLTAPRLTLDLIEDANADSDASVRIRHVSASGATLMEPSGFIVLRAVRQGGSGLLGWVELQAAQLDYETQDANCVARGPGRISLYNSQAAAGRIDPNEFSLRQPCYAFLSQFIRLTYSALTRRIVAESKSRQLQIDYFPLIDIQSGSAPPQQGSPPTEPHRHVEADVGRIEVQLAQAADGPTELVSLSASDGVTYDDGANLFAGAGLFYDHRKALMTITADETTPCYFNGALVGGIEMDVKTRRAKTQIQAPSTLQVK
jgi:hypothetical protein